MDWTTIITCIMSSITTIAVAFIGIYQKKKAKETEEYRRLKEELYIEKQKQIEQEKEKEEQRLVSLENSIKSVKDDVKSLKDDMKQLTQTNMVHIKDQLSRLHTLQSSNMAYIESLSNVVLGIGEILDDSDTVNESDKKKMTQSINAHKKTETELHNKLYNIII